MDQFILVPASVYNNKNLNALAVRKQGLPNYPAEESSTYQTDSIKKEINKKLFANADTLVDKILSRPGIKLSNSQTSILDGVETGVLLSDSDQQLRRKNADVPDIYFSSLDAAGVSPTLVLNENAKSKKKGS